MRFSAFFLLSALLGGLAAAGVKVGTGYVVPELDLLQAGPANVQDKVLKGETAPSPAHVAGALSQSGEQLTETYTLTEMLPMVVAGFPQLNILSDSERDRKLFYGEYCKLVRSVIWRLFEGIFEGQSIYTINDLTYFTENLYRAVLKWLDRSRSVDVPIFAGGTSRSVVREECAYLRDTIKKSQMIFDDLVGKLASQLSLEQLDEVRITISNLLTAFLTDEMGVVPQEGSSVERALALLKGLLTTSLPPKLAISAGGLVIKFLSITRCPSSPLRTASWQKFTTSVLSFVFDLIRANGLETIPANAAEWTFLSKPDHACFLWFGDASSFSNMTMHCADLDKYSVSGLQTSEEFLKASKEAELLLKTTQSRADAIAVQSGALFWLRDIFGKNKMDSELFSTVKADLARKWIQLMNKYIRTEEEPTGGFEDIARDLEIKLEKALQALEDARWEAQALLDEDDHDAEAGYGCDLNLSSEEYYSDEEQNGPFKDGEISNYKLDSPPFFDWLL